MIEVNDNNKPPVVPLVHKGEEITATKWNVLANALNKPFSGVQLPQQVKPDASAKTVQVQQMKVASIAGDYITCYTFDGVVTGTDEITVAKPWMLRRTPFDGETRNGITYTYSDDVTRDASDDDGTETQVIVPSYVVGDLIYAERNIIGGTSLEITMPDNTKRQVAWMDTNRDARAWSDE
jgi:hypothetical protein